MESEERNEANRNRKCYDNTERPQITNIPLPPAFEMPESYNQLNTILSYYELPNMEHSDSMGEKVEKLIAIYNSKHLQLPTNELEDLRRKILEIEELKMLETRCDSWEVELANMKLVIPQKYRKMTLEQLEGLAENLKKENKQSEEFEMYRVILENVNRLDLEAMKSVGFLKEETFGAYVQQKVLDKVEESEEEWAKVILRIVKEDSCKVESLRTEMNMDRVSLLRIIYNFSAKGILEYDRLEDYVSIKANE
ncbi:hypothetical protein GINT2_001280 [Glugoides intestinalis]